MDVLVGDCVVYGQSRKHGLVARSPKRLALQNWRALAHALKHKSPIACRLLGETSPGFCKTDSSLC